jgi:proteasome accessory factor B
MSTERIHRLLRLILRLQSGRATTAAELSAELGISRRTLFRDLKMLELAGIPYYHESGVGYRIARTFYLPPISLTILETLALLLITKTATAQRGRPMVGEALSAVNKLTSTVPEPVRSACNDLMVNVSIAPAAGAIAENENELYSLLQRCVDERRTCRMVYRSRLPGEQGALTLDIDPYLLHFHERAWYVVGRSSVHDQVRIFKLTRVESLEPLKRRFTRPAKFRIEDKIGDAWQMIPEGKTYDIELLFEAKVAVNVHEVKWHHSQQSELLDDGRCRMMLKVDGLGEIAWWLCGYADQVRIVKPTALRKRVRDMLKAAVAKHDGM